MCSIDKKNQDFFAKSACTVLIFLYNAPHTTTHCCERFRL